MTQVSEIIVGWTPEDSGRVSSLQIRSRIKGTTQWQEIASGIDPTVGSLAFTSNAPGSEIEVELRYRMSNGVFSPWTGASVVSAGTKVDYANGVVNKPTKLGDINSAEGGKLTGIAPGADVTGDNISKDTNAVGGTPSSAVISNLNNASSQASSAFTKANQAIADLNTLSTSTLPAINTKIDTTKTDILNTVGVKFQQIDEALEQIEETGFDDTALRTLIENNRLAAVATTGAVATRTTNLEATAGAADGVSINSNPRFAAWPLGQDVPTDWEWWATPATIERGATENGARGTAAPAVTSVANTPTGLASGILYLSAGWYVFEAEVYLGQGAYTGSGLTLGGNYSLNFATEPDTNGTINATGPARRKFSKLVQLPQIDGQRLYAMVGWGGFVQEGGGAKKIWWNRVSIRTASDAETKAQKTFATDLPAIASRVKTTEDTLLDLPNRYAAASRTATVEAQLTGSTPSGLQTTLNARIEDRANAIADAKVGSTASDLQTLRTEYNGTKGEVTTLKASVSGIDGRTKAYIQQGVVAGNNRAQISIYADSNGGAGVDIVGDTTFRGKLEVGTGQSGQRTEITTSGVKVYDANNVLRVQLGVF